MSCDSSPRQGAATILQASLFKPHSPIPKILQQPGLTTASRAQQWQEQRVQARGSSVRTSEEKRRGQCCLCKEAKRLEPRMQVDDRRCSSHRCLRPLPP